MKRTYIRAVLVVIALSLVPWAVKSVTGYIAKGVPSWEDTHGERASHISAALKASQPGDIFILTQPDKKAVERVLIIAHEGNSLVTAGAFGNITGNVDPDEWGGILANGNVDVKKCTPADQMIYPANCKAVVDQIVSSWGSNSHRPPTEYPFNK